MGITCWLSHARFPTAARIRIAAASGLYHVSTGGSTLWHGFAAAILQHERSRHPARIVATTANQITTADLDLGAERPQYSVLTCAALRAAFAIEPPGWDLQLDLCLDS